MRLSMVGERTSNGAQAALWTLSGIGTLAAGVAIYLAAHNYSEIANNKSQLKIAKDSISTLNTNYANLRNSVDTLNARHARDSTRNDSLKKRLVFLEGRMDVSELNYSDLDSTQKVMEIAQEKLKENVGMNFRLTENNIKRTSALEEKVDSLHAPEKAKAEASYVDTAAVLNSASYDLMNQIALDLDSNKIIPHNDSLGGTGGGFLGLGYFFKNWNPLDRFTEDGKITKDGTKNLRKYLSSLDLNPEVDSLIYNVAFDSTKSVSDRTIKRISSEVYDEVLKDTKYKTRGIMHSDLSK